MPPEEEKKPDIADVTTKIENDQQVKVKNLTPAYRVSKRTIHVTLHHDLNLTKKPARWFPKLLTYDMKKESVRTSEAFPLSLHGECSTTLSPWMHLQFHFTLLRPSSSPNSSFQRVSLAQ
jgi:hypothetical protein